MVLPLGQTLIAGEATPPTSNQQEVQLKFLLTGLLSGLPLPPFALRMCPPLTTKNINHYQPLLAVGKQSCTADSHANRKQIKGIDKPFTDSGLKAYGKIHIATVSTSVLLIVCVHNMNQQV